ncbi:MAG: hypothetical protein ACLU4B_02885, partial [Bilophila wadsworthia]
MCDGIVEPFNGSPKLLFEVGGCFIKVLPKYCRFFIDVGRAFRRRLLDNRALFFNFSFNFQSLFFDVFYQTA